LGGFITLEKSVGSGSQLDGLKAIEALLKMKPGFAGGVLNHSLDEQRQDTDLHRGFDAFWGGVVQGTEIDRAPLEGTKAASDHCSVN
jgi:hypothetical protein